MRHIILGDPHLGKGTSIGKPGLINSRIEDQKRLLDYVSNLADTEDCKHIIITGDVYEDPRPHPAIINLFMSWIKDCENRNIRTDTISGNHDIMRTGQYTVSALDIIPTLEMPYGKVHKKVTSVKYDNVNFVLIPYRDKRMYGVQNSKVGLSYLLEEVYKNADFREDIPNVIVGHLAIEGCLEVGDEISDGLNEIFVPPDAFPECTHMWMGHIHHPQVLQWEGPYAAHVGSMDRSDFSTAEMERDKIAIIYDDETHKFEQHVLPTRPLRQIDIEIPNGKDSTEFVINTLAVVDKREPFRNAIVRLDIQLNGQELQNVNRQKVSEFVTTKLNAHHLCKISESRVLNIMSSSDGPTITLDHRDMRANTKQYIKHLDLEEKEADLLQQYMMEDLKELEIK